MSAYMSHEETKQEFIDSMGESLGKLFYAFWNDVHWLHQKWGEYLELYGTKPSRIDLLNETAPLFFRFVQDALWYDIILHIARLTDPPKSVGKDNLTIRRIPHYIEKDSFLEEILSPQIQSALKLSNFTRDWRNRRLAHRDLELALEESAKPIEGASRKSIEEAIEAIDDVLNSIVGHYMDTTINFDYLSPGDGALSLLYYIHLGLNARKERLKRIKNGEVLPGDFDSIEL